MREDLVQWMSDPLQWIFILTGFLSLLIGLTAIQALRLRRESRSLATEVTKGKTDPPKPATSPPTPDRVEDYVVELEQRERSHRISARLYMLGVLFSLALGLGLFLDATFSLQDHDSLDVFANHVAAVSQQLDDINVREGTGAKAMIDSVGAGQIYILNHVCHGCPDSLRIDSVMRRQNRLGEKLGNLMVPLRQVANDVRTIKSGSYQNRILDLITISLIRLGIIIILVYACQILLRVHRYHVRTADHYRALADTLAFADPKGMTVEKLVKVLKSTVDLGKEPMPPMEKVIDAIVKLKG